MRTSRRHVNKRSRVQAATPVRRRKRSIISKQTVRIIDGYSRLTSSDIKNAPAGTVTSSATYNVNGKEMTQAEYDAYVASM